MVKKNDLEYFLSELGRLSRETGITIHGCGCCGSPWLEEAPRTMDPERCSGYKLTRDNLSWDSDEKIYTVDNY